MSIKLIIPNLVLLLLLLCPSLVLKQIFDTGNVWHQFKTNLPVIPIGGTYLSRKGMLSLSKPRPNLAFNQIPHKNTAVLSRCQSALVLQFAQSLDPVISVEWLAKQRFPPEIVSFFVILKGSGLLERNF